MSHQVAFGSPNFTRRGRVLEGIAPSIPGRAQVDGLNQTLLPSLQDAIPFFRWTGGLARSSLDAPATGWHAVGMLDSVACGCSRTARKGPREIR